jgi:hypothetical protein
MSTSLRTKNEPAEHHTNIQFLGEKKTIYRIHNVNFAYTSKIFTMFDDNIINTCNNTDTVINILKNIDKLNPHFRINIEISKTNHICTEYSIFMLACESGNLNLIWSLLPNNLNNLNTEYRETGCGYLTNSFEVIIGKLPIEQGRHIIAYAALNGISPTRPTNICDLYAYTNPFDNLIFNSNV